MPKLLPILYDRFLKVSSNDFIKTDTPEGFNWLRENKGFSVDMTSCRITFRKEKRGKKEFWYALRKINGKVKRIYVGHTGVLTNDCVMRISQKLLVCSSTSE